MAPGCEPRLVTAVMWFAGPAGREDEAAEAWAWELTHYFKRGVGEAPDVSYAGGVYTVSGLMQTTHPWDTAPVSEFTGVASLAFCVNPGRRAYLLGLPQDGPRWDGRISADDRGRG